MIGVVTSDGIFSLEGNTLTKIGQGCYYNLTRYNNYWVTVETPIKRHLQKIPVEDYCYVRFLDDNFKIVDSHEIRDNISMVHGSTIMGDMLIFTDTGSDRLCFFNLKTKEHDFQYLTEEHTKGIKHHTQPKEHDQRHVNTVIMEGDLMRVVCHNYGSSYALAFKNGTIVERQDEIGFGCHDLFRWYDGELWTLSSLMGEVRRMDGKKRVFTGGFPRGVLAKGDKLYVGNSKMRRYLDPYYIQIDRPAGIFIVEGDKVDLVEFNEVGDSEYGVQVAGMFEF